MSTTFLSTQHFVSEEQQKTMFFQIVPVNVALLQALVSSKVIASLVVL